LGVGVLIATPQTVAIDTEVKRKVLSTPTETRPKGLEDSRGDHQVAVTDKIEGITSSRPSSTTVDPRAYLHSFGWRERNEILK
jgi:hypothetical protein